MTPKTDDQKTQEINDLTGSANFFVYLAGRVLKGAEHPDEVIGQVLFGKAGRFLAGLWIATLNEKDALAFNASQYAIWARKTQRRPQPNIRSDLTRFKDLGMIIDVPNPGHVGAKWHARCSSPLWDIFLMAETCLKESLDTDRNKTADPVARRQFYVPSEARKQQMVSDLLDIHDQTSPNPPQRVPMTVPPRRGADAAARARLRPRGPNNELRCSRCRKWKDEDGFSLRTDRPWLYKSRCKECMADVARQRYLHLNKIEALNLAGLTFTVGPSDDVVGLSCIGCGELIVVGDTVHADARLQHERCMTRPETEDAATARPDDR